MNKTNLSVNLNKVALLRNARGSDYPSLVNFAKSCMEHDICGLTLHPRSDERHALSSDVIDLATLCKENNLEFNIEGNPFNICLLYTSPSPRDVEESRMPSSA